MTTIKQRLAKFVDTVIKADVKSFSDKEKKAIRKLVECGKIINNLYLLQAYSDNLKILESLQNEKNYDTLKMFNICKGPWDRTDNDEPFLSSVPNKPPKGANFYPQDLTKKEFDSFLEGLSKEKSSKAMSFYTVIKRDSSKKLEIIDYSTEYKEYLTRCSDLLIEAADLISENKTLSKFLRSRAESFRTNNYLNSEIDWLNISEDSPIEVTLGPYEVYTDNLYSVKAAFEMYIHVRDFEESEELKKYVDSIKFLEQRLPIPEKYKNKELRKTPIIVVNQIYCAGDTALPMTAAYNLPNDEEAIKEGGSKLVIIRNVQLGKFNSILVPISQVVIEREQLKNVSFDAFFTHVLLHEVSHSNGPHSLVDNPSQTVRSKLQEYHSTMEEAKADITGLYAASVFIDNKTITKITKEDFWITYLSSAFRSIRFGLNEAHGRGQAIQLNYLIDKGAVKLNTQTLLFRVETEKMENAVKELVSEIMLLQGNGNYNDVKAFVEKYGVNREYTMKALEKLKHVPIDINPIYETLDDL